MFCQEEELIRKINNNGEMEVDLIDPGGHLKTVPVEAIHQTFISIRWGMSGVYDIDLKTNTMKARSVAARRKGLCHWKAVDINSVRHAVHEYFNPNAKKEEEERFKKHHESMPFRAKPLSSSK